MMTIHKPYVDNHRSSFVSFRLYLRYSAAGTRDFSAGLSPEAATRMKIYFISPHYA